MESILGLDPQNLYALIKTRKDQEAKTQVLLFLQVKGHDIRREGQFV